MDKIIFGTAGANDASGFNLYTCDNEVNPKTWSKS
jgi:hypothetical protein